SARLSDQVLAVQPPRLIVHPLRRRSAAVLPHEAPHAGELVLQGIPSPPPLQAELLHAGRGSLQQFLEVILAVLEPGGLDEPLEAPDDPRIFEALLRLA